DLHLPVHLVAGAGDQVLLEVHDEGPVRARTDRSVTDVPTLGLEIVPVVEERRVWEAGTRQAAVPRRVGAGGRPELDDAVGADGERGVARAVDGNRERQRDACNGVVAAERGEAADVVGAVRRDGEEGDRKSGV